MPLLNEPNRNIAGICRAQCHQISFLRINFHENYLKKYQNKHNSEIYLHRNHKFLRSAYRTLSSIYGEIILRK